MFKDIPNDPRILLWAAEYSQFYGLWDPEDAKLSASDEGPDDHGETSSSSMMPEMRFTIDSGYCLVFREWASTRRMKTRTVPGPA